MYGSQEVPAEVRDGLHELTGLPSAFETSVLTGHLGRIGSKLPEVSESLPVLLQGAPDGPARRRVLRAWRDFERQHRKAVRELERLDGRAVDVAAAAFALLTEIEDRNER